MSTQWRLNAKRRAHDRRFRETLMESVCLCGPATFLAFASRLCIRKGLLKLVGVERARRVLREGRVVVAANHPAKLEVCFIPVIDYPHVFKDPLSLPWTISDRRILRKELRWLFPIIRNIAIDPTNKKHTSKGLRQAVRVLSAGGSIVVYPEGGPTGRGMEFVTEGMRRMRPVAGNVCAVARMINASILPVWVDFEGVTEPLSFGGALARLLRGRKMTIYFGEPYRVMEGSLDEANRELERRILRTGAAED